MDRLCGSLIGRARAVSGILSLVFDHLGFLSRSLSQYFKGISYLLNIERFSVDTPIAN